MRLSHPRPFMMVSRLLDLQSVFTMMRFNLGHLSRGRGVCGGLAPVVKLLRVSKETMSSSHRRHNYQSEMTGECLDSE